MRYMITTALAFCLIGGAASAQDHDHDRGGGRPEGHQGGGQEHRGGGPQGAPGGGRGGQQVGPQGGPGQTHGFRAGPGAQQAAPQGGPAPAGPRFDGRQGAAPGFTGREGGAPGFAGGRDGFRGGAARGPEPGFRPGFYARDHGWSGGRTFHVSPYRYPSGWGYRRWSFGAFLPFAFLAPDYTLYQYWTYGLPAPPPGYHWIRVGPDALLVRYGDGYVLDAIYGVFY